MSAAAPVRALVRRLAAGLRLGLAALASTWLVAGCTTPVRQPAVPAALAVQAQPGSYAIRYRVARDSSDFAEAARESLRRELAWRASQGQTGPLPPAYFLAISGGGDDGAFTAGLLNGWTARGDRPEFKVVTGVSTGALIAPFAFLGPKYDDVLKSVYTDVSQKDIFKRRNIISAFFGDAMSDTTPLYKMISRHVDRALLDKIAAEGARGRVLLVGTTLLDTPEPVIWNMTAIAASQDPGALELFRKVLVASAAIPGAFPPVMIDVELNGVHYQEMHVDGGAMAQVFAYPPTLNVLDVARREGVERKRVLYIIRNARLDAEWANVQRRTLSIAGRAISSLMMTQGIGDLYRIYATTQRDGVDYNLAFVPSSFDTPHKEQFDTTYMRALYKVGYDLGRAGYPWQKTPPGFAAPPIGAKQVAAPPQQPSLP
ncbi:MAG TPA: patatin-like phospholipase family protein [Phenylobacterium sp.]|uniref:patatin-like phospholipase family protein n=1 Tax=Phenylobacterium sp. TaxID=1871053 RepID=UPI002B49AAB7|nr:patatin-like phospholipase family protein [Phenylobacterium sp.]HKR87332.1 patatin-like phospholipase family protein [Phenylobacterium sp.]